jgi:hypothetical protein
VPNRYTNSRLAGIVLKAQLFLALLELRRQSSIIAPSTPSAGAQDESGEHKAERYDKEESTCGRCQ